MIDERVLLTILHKIPTDEIKESLEFTIPYIYQDKGSDSIDAKIDNYKSNGQILGRIVSRFTGPNPDECDLWKKNYIAYIKRHKINDTNWCELLNCLQGKDPIFSREQVGAWACDQGDYVIVSQSTIITDFKDKLLSGRTIVIVLEERKCVGIITVSTLINADYTKTAKEIMTTNITSFSAQDSMNDLVKKHKQLSFDNFIVKKSNGDFMGVVSIQEIVDYCHGQNPKPCQ
jgi:CBS domain-containing protein